MPDRFGHLSTLVVEDHDFQRQVALRLIRKLGVGTVLEAADGRSALDVLGQQEHPVDVALVDLDLPEMDGVELIGRIAQEGSARAVVILTALDPALLNTVQIMTRASGMRVLATVEKPLTQAKLSAALEHYFTEDPTGGASSSIEIDTDMMEAALANEAIHAQFQPQVSIGSGFTTGVEALARWNVDGHWVPPVEFIPRLEQHGLIHQLTEHILAQTCAWQKKWRDKGMHMRVSVNVSMYNLTDVATADRYEAIAMEAGVDPRDVTLEITESAMMQESVKSLNVLARLRLKGFGLSIDDFGTGWSSLSQLAKLPVTEIKIDRSFIIKLATEARSRAVVETSIELGRKLGLATVAEGVSNMDEWQMLAELGCTHAQGELVSMAVPGEKLGATVAGWRRRKP